MLDKSSCEPSSCRCLENPWWVTPVIPGSQDFYHWIHKDITWSSHNRVFCGPRLAQTASVRCNHVNCRSSPRSTSSMINIIEYTRLNHAEQWPQNKQQAAKIQNKIITQNRQNVFKINTWALCQVSDEQYENTCDSSCKKYIRYFWSQNLYQTFNL